MTRLFEISKIMLTFVKSKLSRAVMPRIIGHIFCPKDRRRYSYREIPKGLQSPAKELDTVKSNAVHLFIVLSIINVKSLAR